MAEQTQAHATGREDTAREAANAPEVVFADPDRDLDLRGEVCPYTLVKSKLMLETMAPGEVLRLIVDNNPKNDSLPLSLEIEGHQLLSVSARDDGTMEIIVRCMLQPT